MEIKKGSDEFQPLLRDASLHTIKEHHSEHDEEGLLGGNTQTGEMMLSKGDNDESLDMNKPIDYTQYSRGKQALLFVIMLLVNVLGPLSTEAQVPALQDIANDLNTTSQWVQLTITIYMLSFGASQLVFGTLSDMYGRRNTLIVGLVIYVATNVGCALSPNIIALNVFRAVQAMGSGAGMVIVYAIARDVFVQDERTRVLGILGGTRPIVIASSPVFGAAVTAYLGWRYIFWIIGGLSFGCLILVIFLLPETKDPSTVSIRKPSDYYATFRKLIKKRVFVGLVLISGAVYAGVFIMFNEFSFVMENTYGFDELWTGYICGGVVLGLLMGSLISIAFVKIMSPITVVCIGIGLIFVCAGLLIVPVVMYGSDYPTLTGITLPWTIVPLFLYVCADGLMLPHLVSTALEPFKDCAGTASALAGFWRFFSAAAIALITSSVTSDHLVTLHVGPAAMAVFAAVLYVCTLAGADASEFTKNCGADQSRSALQLADESQPLIDVTQTVGKNTNTNYGTDTAHIGVTVCETDSD